MVGGSAVKQRHVFRGSHAPKIDKFPFLTNPIAELKHNCPNCKTPGTYKSTIDGDVRMICSRCATKWTL